jgi:hypothetical protein
MAEFTSIASALVAHGRGANLPYFGKQGNIMPYSPRETKRKAIRGFPGMSDMTERGMEPNLGLLRIRIQAASGNVCHRICSGCYIKKKEIYWSIFTDDSISGTFPEIGKTAPAAGCTSMYTLEPAVIGFTLNVI